MADATIPGVAGSTPNGADAEAEVELTAEQQDRRRRLIDAPMAARMGFRPIGQILGTTSRLEAPTGR